MNSSSVNLAYSFDKRVVLTVAICLAIALTFWLSSRVPALNEKAAMGGDLLLVDPLSFETAFLPDESDSLITRIGATTINWVVTNRQGMTFGVLLAAAFMTLFQLIAARLSNNSFGNSLFGIVLGSSLGVCVNCATPIAQGMYSAGARLESALILMFSSPTLNIIVITMMFTLLPLHFVVIKLLATFLFLLVVIPLLVRVILPEDVPSDLATDQFSQGFRLSAVISPPPGAWFDALSWVLQRYLENLWYILKRAVPAMLLAGVLGAAAITLLPWDTLESLPVSSGFVSRLAVIIGIAVFGLFLPVPMAFDVLMAVTLIGAGISSDYLMALLFTLGIFSVYPFMIIARDISFRMAMMITYLLVLVAVAASLGAYHYEEFWIEPKKRAVFYEQFTTQDWGEKGMPSGYQIEDNSFTAEPLGWNPVDVGNSGLHVQAASMNPPTAMDDKLFTRGIGESLGVTREGILPVGQLFTPPYYRNWPISSGDINNDGWADLVMGSGAGIHLYLNNAGRTFTRQPVAIPQLQGMRIDNTALVDLNGDGRLDLFLSSYRDGNHVIFNEGKQFADGQYLRLPDDSANLANATAFGDLDRDGDIDIFLGNWTSGPWTPLPGEPSRNIILWNEDGAFHQESVEGAPGETLTVLISDLNQDGYPDVFVGNDFDQADMIYLGSDSGLKKVSRTEGLFQRVTMQTMSLDSGDIDNDLSLEIYAAQVTGHFDSDRSRTEQLLPGSIRCDEYDDGDWRERCVRRLEVHEVTRLASTRQDPSVCSMLTVRDDLGECLAFQLLETAARFNKDPALCDLFPARWKNFAAICLDAQQEPPVYDAEQTDLEIPQVWGVNMLFTSTDEKRYIDVAEQMGVDLTGWTWNAKFNDLDNDGWLDLFAVNGFYRSDKRESNLFFRNSEGNGFRDETSEAGLENYLGTATYTVLDMDNDGDLDLVTVSMEGPVWIYRNNTQANSISFELDNGMQNRFAIGARIVIRYGENNDLKQLRELKAGGGFLSYDAPQAWFGLGNYDAVNQVEITWPDGSISKIDQVLEARNRYRITRTNAERID